MGRATTLVLASLITYFSGIAAAAELPEPGQRIPHYPSLKVKDRPRDLEPPYILPREFQKCLSKVLSFRDRNFKSIEFDIQFVMHSEGYLAYALLRTQGAVRAGDWPPYQMNLGVNASNCKIIFFHPSNLNEFENIPPHPEITLE